MRLHQGDFSLITIKESFPQDMNLLPDPVKRSRLHLSVVGPCSELRCMAGRTRFKERKKQRDQEPGIMGSATQDDLVILGADPAIVKFFDLTPPTRAWR